MIGPIAKMKTEHKSPVSYHLPLGQERLHLNPLLGQKISLRFVQKIACAGCGVAIKKSYQQGYCFPCTQKLAQCDLCIVKPERCHYHLGTCRQPEWGETNCFIPHVVYLANVTGLKVGITRKTQLPTRWIDQGALEALPLLEVGNRRISGLLEIFIAQHMQDKSNWRKILMGAKEAVSLQEEAQKILPILKDEITKIQQHFGQGAVRVLENVNIAQFDYPVLEYPKKITSLGFDKKDHIEGTLLGIKGQYLIFDTGVINIRKHTGYHLECIV
jgi:hypothetical protein